MKIKNIENISRVKWAIQNKVIHFAPTISPAPKNIERNEIESLYNAMLLYKEKGVTEVILQPKYMGSYCDVLITENIDNSMFFSKKGYVIDHLDRNKLISALQPIHDIISSKIGWVTLSEILIQSELLPWSVMGNGLINREFVAYNDVHKIHYDYLLNSGIIGKINSIKSSIDMSVYESDIYKLSKDDINKKYKPHDIKFLDGFKYIDTSKVDILNEGVAKHKKQIDIYGKQSDFFEFKPFNILKMIYKDGTDVINQSNIYGFTTLSADECITLDLNDFEISVEKAYIYYHKVIGSMQMEGIIIKPNDVYIDEIAPMLKVRNNDYLTLIYGVDFDANFNHYISKRRVSKKIKLSINEWKISQALLRINKKNISSDNEYYIDLIEKRIYEESLEETLDSRL